MYESVSGGELCEIDISHIGSHAMCYVIVLKVGADVFS